MARKLFESQDQINRVWPILDGVARRAWERQSVGPSQRQAVGHAAGALLNQMNQVCRDLPREDRGQRNNPPRGVDVDKDNWSQFARDELVEMIGREDICSIADAFLKTKSLLRALQGAGTYGHQRFLFRGQRDISWKLLPRKGRALIKAGWTPPDQPLCERKLTRTLPEELESLTVFCSHWGTLDEVEDVDRAKQLPPDHPEWWFRMQHYDPGEGTRLLDVTTSLTAALLFACVDWSSGTVDDTTDGVVYLWSEGHNGNVDDFLIQEMPQTADRLFSQYPDAPRYIFNPPHTERSKAQAGGFMWWPRFWEDPPYQGAFFLRVAAGAKFDIVHDLLSMGFGPKEAVRGIKGLQNECSLRAQLGLRSWRPLQLGG